MSRLVTVYTTAHTNNRIHISAYTITQSYPHILAKPLLYNVCVFFNIGYSIIYVYEINYRGQSCKGGSSWTQGLHL